MTDCVKPSQSYMTKYTKSYHGVPHVVCRELKKFHGQKWKKLILSCSYSSNSMYISENSLITLNKLKLSNESKNDQNYTWINLCSLLLVQTVLKSNPNSIVALTPNLTESYSTLRFFFCDTSVCKHRTW